jgi:hypothetical protein
VVWPSKVNVNVPPVGVPVMVMVWTSSVPPVVIRSPPTRNCITSGSGVQNRNSSIVPPRSTAVGW